MEDEVQSVSLTTEDGQSPVSSDPEPSEPQLSSEELVSLRWMLFGICPLCRANVKDWAPGPFNAERYNGWLDKGIDPLTGHMKTCDEKWRRA